MQLGCVSYLINADSEEERFDQAARLGFDALEFLVFPDTDWETWQRPIRRGIAASGLRVSALIACDTMTNPRHLAWFEKAIDVASDLGAVLVLTPEYGTRNPPPAVPPLAPPPEEMQIVRGLMRRIGQYAQPRGARVAVEAINRYETRFVRSLDEAVGLACYGGSETGVVGDLFHMNMEEQSVPESLYRVGPRLMHVHLADSNRYLPGLGHLDFRPVFRALQGIRYDSAMSFECGIPAGQPNALATAVQTIRKLWTHAGEDAPHDLR